MMGACNLLETFQTEEPVLERVAMSQLPGWPEAFQSHGALESLRASCTVPKTEPLYAYGQTVALADWQRVCRYVALLPPDPAPGVLTDFFQHQFDAWRVRTTHRNRGVLTGYFTPLVTGSMTREHNRQVPVYGLPPEPLRRAFSRQAIENGALDGQGLEVLWLDDPIEAFFLHIQGSGYVELRDGTVKQLVYAGKNGFPYTAIGRGFIERGEASPDEMSMQWLKDWLTAHPDQAEAVMQQNASYIYLALQEVEAGIRGAEGSALTPHHSLAVDPVYLSYGLPVLVDANHHKTLAVAQDTGSAIRGAMRGDLYLGMGEEAAQAAGRLNAALALHVLLPRAGRP
jgi:membrane-bound lytic murein transglycosylase A